MLSYNGFALFYLQQYHRVVLFLLKVGATESEAEDAAQEAMAQVIKAWERLDFPAAWVRKAALNSYVRQAQRKRQETSALGQTVHINSSGGRSEIDLQEEQWRVITIIRQLPPEQRAVAALHYDGLTHEEIAEVLGKSTGNTRSLLRHARARLKEVIQSEGVGSQDAEK